MLPPVSQNQPGATTSASSLNLAQPSASSTSSPKTSITEEAMKVNALNAKKTNDKKIILDEVLSFLQVNEGYENSENYTDLTTQLIKQTVEKKSLTFESLKFNVNGFCIKVSFFETKEAQDKYNSGLAADVVHGSAFLPNSVYSQARRERMFDEYGVWCNSTKECESVRKDLVDLLKFPDKKIKKQDMKKYDELYLQFLSYIDFTRNINPVDIPVSKNKSSMGSAKELLITLSVQSAPELTGKSNECKDDGYDQISESEYKENSADTTISEPKQKDVTLPSKNQHSFVSVQEQNSTGTQKEQSTNSDVDSSNEKLIDRSQESKESESSA